MSSTLFITRLRYSKYSISFLFVTKLYWIIFYVHMVQLIQILWPTYLSFTIIADWPKIVNEQKHKKARSSLPKINQAE